MNLFKTACVVSVLSLALSACGDKAEKKVETDAAQEVNQSQTMSNDAAAPAATQATEETAPAQDSSAEAQQPAADASAETKSE